MIEEMRLVYSSQATSNNTEMHIVKREHFPSPTSNATRITESM